MQGSMNCDSLTDCK